MSKKSTQIALGGVFSALCLLMMFLTGILPFATYAMPIFAGGMLMAVVVENGRKAALMVYISVSILSLFIVPDREAAMMFIVFFGYYPIIKGPLDMIRPRIVSWVTRFAIFNLAVLGGYLAMIYLLGMPQLMSDFGNFGHYATVLFLLAGNFVFLLCDFALEKYLRLYVSWFKPTFLRR